MIMALPRGFRKNLKLGKQKVGPERRQELLDDIANQGTFLPKGVDFSDMDKSVVDSISKDFTFEVDGKKVPVIFLTIQKWSELSRTWEHSDDFGNIKMPFISVVRVTSVSNGTNQNGYWNEVGIQKYSYVKVPTYEGGRRGVDVYKIPQPASVDVHYEVRLFTNRMAHINMFNEIIQKRFQSRQHYVFPNEHPMPLILDSISDESKTDDFDKRRFYVQMAEMRLLGYLLYEDEFEVVPTVNRIVVNEEIIQPKVKTSYKVKKKGNITELTYYFVIKPKTNNRFDFKSDFDIKFSSIETDNLNNISFKVNGVPVTLPFIVMAGDVIHVNFQKDFYKTANFELHGKIL